MFLDEGFREVRTHRDPPKTDPPFAALTVDNPNPDNPWCGGALFLADGLISIDYQPGDLVIMDGRLLHGVTAMCALPAAGPKTVDGKGPQELPREQFIRHSHIHFSRAGYQ